MKIRILDRAEEDLFQGFVFYEEQQAGIGDYFLNSLASDIGSLKLYAGISSNAIRALSTAALEAISFCGLLHRLGGYGLGSCGIGLQA